MTNNISPISTLSSLYGGSSTQSNSSTSSTTDILSSFKEIMTVMTAMNGLSSSSMSGLSSMSSPYQSGGAGSGMSMSDLMAPLMLLMMERLIEQQLEHDTPTTGQTSSATASATTGVYGSKPVPSGLPVQGGRISQEAHTGHMALDIAIPTGTEIRSTMDGNVVHAGWNDQGYGNLVIVENGNYRTYYAHLSSIPVSVGDQVAAGTTIGLSGSTGNSTGPHLHYEIRKNKVTIDPTTATLG
jgi:murein DD-endopeptidase MepM/ murein hydrolase activator NlpD